jgi:cephalosporin hydroxylase
MDHFYQNIHGWMDYENLYQQMVKAAPETSWFVEVGSWKGKSAAFMCVEIANSGKTIRFDCVDTWQGSACHQLGGIFQDEDCVHNRLLQKFQENLISVQHMFTAVQLPSLQAAKLYKDSSLDFVFIDADHEYESIVADIEAWLPKVKAGGYIAGHDYPYPPVNLAVTQLLPHAQPFTGGCWIYQIPT